MHKRNREQYEDEEKHIDIQQFQDQITALQQHIDTPNSTGSFQQLCFNHIKNIAISLQQRPVLDGEEDVWPTNSPTDVKIQFLMSMGLLSPTSQPLQIANYLTTLESLNSNEDGCMMYNIQRLMSHGTNNLKTQAVIETNIAFCALLSPEALVGTSYEHIQPSQYANRVQALQRLHAQNVMLYRQIVEVAKCRVNNQPLSRLYEDPPQTGDMSENQDFDMPEKLAPHQHLLEYLLQFAGARGLRKSEKGIFEEVINLPEHVGTRFYVFVENFEKWAWDAIAPNNIHKYEDYCMTLRPGTPRHIANMLAMKKDPRLPILKKRRTLFSYRNGIFDALTGWFHVYTHGPNLPDYIHFIDELSPDECSAQFFDYVVDLIYFKPGFDKSQMPLTAHRKILVDQHFDEETIVCWNVIHGRTLHDSGSMEDWQVASWVTGCTGSGKSLHGKNWAGVYPEEDVGIISDDVEEHFTDQHLRHANMVIGLDVSESFNVSANRLYGWIGSDNMVIKIKGQEAITMRWRAVLMFFSNVWPAIVSKSGAALRRFVFFIFNYAIQNTDTRMHIALKEELPLYVIQTGLYYLDWVNKYGKVSLWENRPAPETGRILPPMCYEGKKEYADRISPPDAFLDSPTCEYDPSYFCDVAVFKRHYLFFRTSHVKAPQGPQRTRAYNPDVTQLSFAYALKNRNCHWDTEKKIIVGLRCTGSIEDSSTTKRIVINAPPSNQESVG